MDEEQTIPNSVIGTVAQILGKHYNSHSRLNTLFQSAGAPGEPPPGNCVEKCRSWLSSCNRDYSINQLEILGNLIQKFMDNDSDDTSQDQKDGQERIRKSLAKNNLTYQLNGIILKSGAGLPSRQLVDILHSGDFTVIENEFHRSLTLSETDPPAAITAASSLVEALCKTYIEDNGLQMPDTQTITPLWKIIRDHIGLVPSPEVQEDMKRIMQGLASIIDGVGALRTHVGSAHGRSPSSPTVSPIEARLAVNSAHTAAIFILETWNSKKKK